MMNVLLAPPGQDCGMSTCTAPAVARVDGPLSGGDSTRIHWRACADHEDEMWHEIGGRWCYPPAGAPSRNSPGPVPTHPNLTVRRSS